MKTLIITLFLFASHCFAGWVGAPWTNLQPQELNYYVDTPTNPIKQLIEAIEERWSLLPGKMNYIFDGDKTNTTVITNGIEWLGVSAPSNALVYTNRSFGKIEWETSKFGYPILGSNTLAQIDSAILQMIPSFVDTNYMISGTFNDWFSREITNGISVKKPMFFPAINASVLLPKVGGTNLATSTIVGWEYTDFTNVSENLIIENIEHSESSTGLPAYGTNAQPRTDSKRIGGFFKKHETILNANYEMARISKGTNITFESLYEYSGQTNKRITGVASYGTNALSEGGFNGHADTWIPVNSPERVAVKSITFDGSNRCSSVTLFGLTCNPSGASNAMIFTNTIWDLNQTNNWRNQSSNDVLVSDSETISFSETNPATATKMWCAVTNMTASWSPKTGDVVIAYYSNFPAIYGNFSGRQPVTFSQLEQRRKALSALTVVSATSTDWVYSRGEGKDGTSPDSFSAAKAAADANVYTYSNNAPTRNSFLIDVGGGETRYRAFAQKVVCTPRVSGLKTNMSKSVQFYCGLVGESGGSTIVNNQMKTFDVDPYYPGTNSECIGTNEWCDEYEYLPYPADPSPSESATASQLSQWSYFDGDVTYYYNFIFFCLINYDVEGGLNYR